MGDRLREWSPVLAVIGALAVIGLGEYRVWIVASLSEAYLMLAGIILWPVAAIVAALRWERSPDRFYWVAIIVLAPTLGPLVFFVVSLVRVGMRRATSRSATSAIGFRAGSDERSGPQASALQPTGF